MGCKGKTDCNILVLPLPSKTSSPVHVCFLTNRVEHTSKATGHFCFQAKLLELPSLDACCEAFPFIAISYLSIAMFNLHASVLYLWRRNWCVVRFHYPRYIFRG